MSKTPFDESSSSDSEMLPEYQFDYRKAKPNRFASQSESQKAKIIVLDDDVAKVFTTSESVNKVLRALIEVMPGAANS
jgi:hypothetical protein